MAALTALAQPAIATVIGSIAPIVPDPIVLSALILTANGALATITPNQPYGMCGGMAYASLDYWHARAQLPRGANGADQPTRATAVGSLLRNTIWFRLLDSLRQGGALHRTLEWSLLLNQVPAFLSGGPGALLGRTLVEWNILKRTIDSGQPCPIGLIYNGRPVWDQHQILAYGYEDRGNGTATMYVYDSNSPFQYGSVGHDIVTLDFTGASLVATSPSDFGTTLAGFFCTSYTAIPPPPGLATSFGQFASWTGDPRSWITAYGGRMPIADSIELMALGGTTADVRATGTTGPGLEAPPRDGALLRERNAAPVFLYQGGSPFWVPDPTWLDRFGGWGAVRVVPDGSLASFVGPPEEGTLLREWSLPDVYRMMAGKRRWVTSPVELARYGGFPTVRVVPDGALASIPVGRPLPDVGIGDHFYTISDRERDNAVAQYGYLSEGIACYVIGSPATVPLYRMLSASTGDHFFTTGLAERDIALSDHGYVSEDISCFVHLSPVAGTTPLHRLFNAMNGDHFYTTSDGERDNAVAQYGYVAEGVACHVYGSQAADTTALHRLLNPANGDHFYTISDAERDNAVAHYGYLSEGIACYVTESPAALPFYRLLSSSTGDHFYTAGLAERDVALSSHGYVSEEIGCFVHGSPVAGTTPLHRLFNPMNGDHFYTTSDGERDNAVVQFGYVFEGVACHVYGSQTADTTPLHRLVKVP